MKRIIAVAIALGLAGCTEAIHLRNMSGMVVTCGPYTTDDIGSNSSALRESQCIADYQRQGYERAPN